MKATRNIIGDEITLHLTPDEALAIVNAIGWQRQGIADRGKGFGRNEGVDRLLDTSNTIEREIERVMA